MAARSPNQVSTIAASHLIDGNSGNGVGIGNDSNCDVAAVTATPASFRTSKSSNETATLPKSSNSDVDGESMDDFDLLEKLHIARSQVHSLQEKLGRRTQAHRRILGAGSHGATDALVSPIELTTKHTAGTADRAAENVNGINANGNNKGNAKRAACQRVRIRMRTLMDEYPAQLQEVVGSPSSWSRRASLVDGQHAMPFSASHAGPKDHAKTPPARPSPITTDEMAATATTPLSLHDEDASNGDDTGDDSTDSVDHAQAADLHQLAAFCTSAETHTTELHHYKTFSFRIQTPSGVGRAAERQQNARCCVCFCTSNRCDLAFSMTYSRRSRTDTRSHRQTRSRESESPSPLSPTTNAARRGASAVVAIRNKLTSVLGAGLKSAWTAMRNHFVAPPLPRVLATYVRRTRQQQQQLLQGQQHRGRGFVRDRTSEQQQRAHRLAQVCSMGFAPPQARLALQQADGCVEAAVELLVASGVEPAASRGSSDSSPGSFGDGSDSPSPSLQLRGAEGGAALCDETDWEVDDLDAQLRAFKEGTSDTTSEATTSSSAAAAAAAGQVVYDVVPLRRVAAGSTVHTFDIPVPAAAASGGGGNGGDDDADADADAEFEIVFFNCDSHGNDAQVCFRAACVATAEEASSFFSRTFATPASAETPAGDMETPTTRSEAVAKLRGAADTVDTGGGGGSSSASCSCSPISR